MEAILSFILNFINEIFPFFIVDQYENAILLRGGKYTGRIYRPGIYFKISFYDKPLIQSIIYTTLSIPVQSLITLDGKEIVVKGIVKYKVEDVETFLLEVYDAIDAIADTAQSIIAKECSKRTWAELREEDIDNEITKKLRVVLKRWGIHVEMVTLSDKTTSRSFRFFNESNLL